MPILWSWMIISMSTRSLPEADSWWMMANRWLEATSSNGILMQTLMGRALAPILRA